MKHNHLAALFGERIHRYALVLGVVGCAVIIFSPALTNKAFAAAAEFYSPVSGGTSGTGTPTPCQSGDFSLTPGVNFPQGSMHCLRMPAGSINTQATAQPAGTTTCPAGQGGLNLGGFGFHCLPNDPTSPVYVGGAPIITNATAPGSGSSGTGNANLTPLQLTDEPQPSNDQCGNKDASGKGTVIDIGFNIGCKGTENPGPINPIMDMLFAVVRFLSAGVGIVIVGSLIYAGFQYLTSQGEPAKIQAASLRALNTAIALGIYLVTFAFLNWIVPGGMFI